MEARGLWKEAAEWKYFTCGSLCSSDVSPRSSTKSMPVSKSLITFEVIVLCHIMKSRKLGKHSWVVMEVSINLAYLGVNLFGSMKAFSFVSFNYHFSLSCRVRQISFQPWIICLYAVLPIFFFNGIHFEWKAETATWNLALIFPQTPFYVTQPMSISNSIYDLCVPYWHAVDFSSSLSLAVFVSV